MTAILAFGRERFLSGVGDLAARELGEQEAEEERLVQQVSTNNKPLSRTYCQLYDTSIPNAH